MLDTLLVDWLLDWLVAVVECLIGCMIHWLIGYSVDGLINPRLTGIQAVRPSQTSAAVQGKRHGWAPAETLAVRPCIPGQDSGLRP